MRRFADPVSSPYRAFHTLPVVGEAAEVFRRSLVRVEIKSLTNRDSLDGDSANLVRSKPINEAIARLLVIVDIEVDFATIAEISRADEFVEFLAFESALRDLHKEADRALYQRLRMEVIEILLESLSFGEFQHS